MRRQFPLTAAYATTFNSCQGLTLDRMGADLTKPVFSHRTIPNSKSTTWDGLSPTTGKQYAERHCNT